MRRIYPDSCGFSLPLEGKGFSLPPGARAQDDELHVAHMLLMDKSLPPSLYQMISPSVCLTPGSLPETQGVSGLIPLKTFRGRVGFLAADGFGV